MPATQGIPAERDDPTTVALHAAATAGQSSLVQQLLAAGADLEAPDATSQTALHAAAKAGSVEVVQQLLAAGSIVDAADSSSLTPLHKAAAAGHDAVVSCLLTAGASLEAVNIFGCTPLHVAAVSGQQIVAKILLVAGAKLEAAASNGATPLSAAVVHGHIEVAQLLVAAGADVSVEWKGSSLLHIAVLPSKAGAPGNHVAVQALLAAGADVNAAAANGNVGTPLHIAAGTGQCEVVRLLLEAGACLEATNLGGRTPMFLAAAGGHVEVVQQLLVAGAQVDAADSNGTNSLYAAASYGHVEVVQQLLSAGAHVDAADVMGKSPLCIAACYGEVEVAQLLLAAGADVNRNFSGSTILHAIATAGPAKQRKDGQRAIHLVTPTAKAIGSSSTEVMARKPAPDNHVMAQALLAAGANVNAVDTNGCTPLHLAALYGRNELVQVLLKAGADPQRRVDGVDFDGVNENLTALHAAAAGGHDRTLQLLLEAWGQPEVTADELITAANVADSYDHMATYARLAFQLHKRYPAESSSLFEVEYEGEDPGPLPGLSALLESWAIDTRGIREEQAAVRAQADDLAAVRRGVQQLVVGMACMQKYAE